MVSSRAGTFRAVWAHTRWRTLLVSYAVSSVGDLVYAVSIVAYLLEATGSPAWVAASFVGRMLVWILFGAVGGVIAERLDRRRTMVALDLLRGGVMITVALAVVVDASPHIVVALVLLTAAAGTVFRPAAIAAVPAVLAETELAAANAAVSTVYTLAMFVGPALGGLIITVSSVEIAFVINGASFVVSAALISRVGDVGGGARDGVHRQAAEGVGAWLRRDLAAGARVVGRVPGLVVLLVVMAAGQFLLGTEQVVQVLVVTERLGWGTGAIGALNAALGAGGLLAALVVGRLARQGDAGALLGGAVIVGGVAFALVATTALPAFVLALAAVEGATTMIAEVLSMTLLQRLCPLEFLSRVYALMDSTTAVTQLAGCVLAPFLVTFVSLEAAILVGGGVYVVTGIVVLPSLIAVSRQADRRRDHLRPIVERLGAIGLFTDARAGTLDRLAAEVEHLAVPAGTVVITEGDPADDVYVIEDGALHVATGGVHVREMGPGGWFGEIGLLRGIPRTATVTATTDASLMVLPGPAFLEAVADPGSADPVRKLMAARLAETHPQLLAMGTID